MFVRIRDDFSLKKIMESGQCFRVAETGNGWYRFITRHHVLYIRQTDKYEYEVNCRGEEWETIWTPYFDLNRNYAALREQIPEKDVFLTKAAEEAKGIRILRQDPWETLITFIISQRKSIPAIKGAVENLAKRGGDVLCTPFETICAFPDAERMASFDEQILLECRLGYRAPYVLSAIRNPIAPEELAALDDEELLIRLEKIKGVGIKIASCVALFAYGRMGVAPVDTWIGKIIQSQYGGHCPFPDYCGAAGLYQQYMFYYVQQHKDYLNTDAKQEGNRHG